MQRSQRDEKLRGGMVAPGLDGVGRRRDRRDVREGRLAQPDVGQFVRECEHLRGLAVGAIDEHQRSKIVGQGKASELVRIELAAGVVADDAVRHHEHTESVGLLNESPQRFGPSRQRMAFVEVESQRRSHALSSRFDSGRRSGRPDEGQRFFSLHASEVPVPVLALLAEDRLCRGGRRWGG